MRIHSWPATAIAASAALAAGAASRLPCAVPGASNRQATTLFCYSDINTLFLNHDAAFPAAPYLSYPLEYPVLTGLYSYVAAAATAAVTRTTGAGPQSLVYVVISVAGLAACGLFAWLLVLRVNPRAGRSAGVCLPAVVLAGLVNWDLLAVVLAVAAVWHWRRGDVPLAGVLLAAGTSAKLFPVVLLVPMAALALRRRRHRDLATLLAYAAGGWTAINIVFLVQPRLREGAGYFWTLNRTRTDDPGTLWFIFARITGWPRGSAVNIVSAAALIAGLTAVAIIGLRATRPPSIESLSALAVGAMLLTNKVWSEQYFLWILPFALCLSLPLALLLIWQLAEIVYTIASTWYDLPLDAPVAVTTPTFVVVSAIHWLAIAGLCAHIASTTRRRSEDANVPGPRYGTAPDQPTVSTPA